MNKVSITIRVRNTYTICRCNLLVLLKFQHESCCNQRAGLDLGMHFRSLALSLCTLGQSKSEQNLWFTALLMLTSYFFFFQQMTAARCSMP